MCNQAHGYSKSELLVFLDVLLETIEESALPRDPRLGMLNAVIGIVDRHPEEDI